MSLALANRGGNVTSVQRFVGSILVSFGTLAAAQGTTQPAALDEQATLRAEVRMLRTSIERRDAEIARLEGRVAELAARLEALGVRSSATAPAADEEPKRIVFVRATSHPETSAEIIRAVDGMTSLQWFNVLESSHDGGVLPFQPQLVPANEKNKEKAREYMGRNRIPGSNPLDAVEAAAKWRPDVIWFLYGGGPKDPDEFVARVRRAVAGSKTRVNTTTKFCYGRVEREHLMWRVADATGGTCVNAKGEAIDEPALPLRQPPPPPEDPKPTILRSR